jgi:hypothetical protein
MRPRVPKIMVATVGEQHEADVKASETREGEGRWR